jgi:hypothetical protein
MWTPENRGPLRPSKLRYPNDLANQEWSLIQPLFPPAKAGGGGPAKL